MASPDEQISDRLRSVGDGLIIAFPVETTTVAGMTVETTRLYFFRVASQTRYFQRYTALAAINDGNTTPNNGYNWLGNTGVASGDDIFRMETDDWHVQHFGFAPNHPDLKVYMAVSPDANGNPAQDRDGSGEDITPGSDERGYIAQPQIADQYDPPATTERVAFRNDDDGQFLQWAFWADGSNLSGNELDLIFTGRGYKLQPVTNVGMQQLMMEMALSDPDDPVIDTTMVQIGGVNNYRLGSEEPDDWATVRKNEPGFTWEFDAGDPSLPPRVPNNGPPQTIPPQQD